MVGPTSPMLHTKSQYHRSSGSEEEYALWSPAEKGLTSWLSFVVSVSLLLSHWYPGSGVILDCNDSWSLHPYLLFKCFYHIWAWRSSWSCDQNIMHKLLLTYHKKSSHEI